MKNRKFNLEKILLMVSLFIYVNLYSQESNQNFPSVKGGKYPVSSRARVRINIAPIFTDYDSDYFDYEDDYSKCIPYYYHYGYPPSAFNFGLRMRGDRAYYYCPRGYYYKRSRYRNPHHGHMERKHGGHRH